MTRSVTTANRIGDHNNDKISDDSGPGRRDKRLKGDEISDANEHDQSRHDGISDDNDAENSETLR